MHEHSPAVAGFQTLVLLVVILLLSAGCAQQFVSKRVEGNDYFSDKLPRIHVRVGSDFVAKDHSRRLRPVHAAERLTKTTQISENSAVFHHQSGSAALIIRAEHVMTNNWFMNPVSYDAVPGVLSSGRVDLLDEEYATGIWVTGGAEGRVLMVRGYGRVAGPTTRFEILYLEAVEPNWKTVSTLNRQQKAFVEAFARRADASFQVLPFPPEEQRPPSETQPEMEPDRGPGQTPMHGGTVARASGGLGQLRLLRP